MDDVPVAGFVLYRRMGLRRLAIAATAWGAIAVLSVLLREAAIPPGIAQRINFMAHLVWVAMIAAATWKIAPTTKRQHSSVR